LIENPSSPAKIVVGLYPISGIKYTAY